MDTLDIDLNSDLTNLPIVHLYENIAITEEIEQHHLLITLCQT